MTLCMMRTEEMKVVKCMMVVKMTEMTVLTVVKMTDHWKMSIDGVILNTTTPHTVASTGTTHQSTQHHLTHDNGGSETTHNKFLK